MKAIKTTQTNQFIVVDKQVSKSGVAPSVTTIKHNLPHRHVCFELSFKEKLFLLFGLKKLWATTISYTNLDAPFFNLEVKNEKELLKDKNIYNEITKK